MDTIMKWYCTPGIKIITDTVLHIYRLSPDNEPKIIQFKHGHTLNRKVSEIIYLQLFEIRFEENLFNPFLNSSRCKINIHFD